MIFKSFIFEKGFPAYAQEGAAIAQPKQLVIEILEMMLSFQKASLPIFNLDKCFGTVYLQDLILFLINDNNDHKLFFHKLNFEVRNAILVMMRIKELEINMNDALPYLQKIYNLLNRNINVLADPELLKMLILSKEATAVYTGMEINIEMANDSMISFWGKDKTVIGRSMQEAIPELAGQPFIGLIQNVWQTGIKYEAVNTPAQLLVNGRLQQFYFDFCYRAVKSESGKVGCILHTATNVTERVLLNSKHYNPVQY